MAQGPQLPESHPPVSPEPQALLSRRFASAAGARLQIPFTCRLASAPDSPRRQIRLTRLAPPSPGSRRVAACVAVGCGARSGPHGGRAAVLGCRRVCGRLPGFTRGVTCSPTERRDAAPLPGRVQLSVRRGVRCPGRRRCQAGLREPGAARGATRGRGGGGAGTRALKLGPRLRPCGAAWFSALPPGGRTNKPTSQRKSPCPRLFQHATPKVR